VLKTSSKPWVQPASASAAPPLTANSVVRRAQRVRAFTRAAADRIGWLRHLARTENNACKSLKPLGIASQP
jgi:hypothetical protein